MDVKALGSKMALVQAAVAMTSLCPILVKKSGIDLMKIKGQFCRARIVNGRTGKIVENIPICAPLWLKHKLNKILEDEIMMVYQDNKWVPVKNDERKLQCTTCYGYGVWSDEDDKLTGAPIPMTKKEAEQGIFSEPCPWCKADNFYYWDNECRSYEISSTKNKKEVFSDTMTKYMRKAKCKPPEMPW